MLTINVTPAGADLIIAALRQLPHSQVHDLVMDLFNQCKAQQPQQQVELPIEDEKAGGTD